MPPLTSRGGETVAKLKRQNQNAKTDCPLNEDELHKMRIQATKDLCGSQYSLFKIDAPNTRCDYFAIAARTKSGALRLRLFASDPESRLSSALAGTKQCPGVTLAVRLVFLLTEDHPRIAYEETIAHRFERVAS